MEIPHIPGELSLRETQLAALNILKRVHDVCREEGFRYWVMYGTLIGAVRHRGFIPWDDDVDIAMPRPDYERFTIWFREHADEMQPLVLIRGDEKDDKPLPFLISRVSDTTYKMVGDFSSEVDNLGAFIDVYPIDGCGDTTQDAAACKQRSAKLMMKYLQAGNFNYFNNNNGILKKALKRMHAVILGNPERYLTELMDIAASHPYNSAKFVSCIIWQAEEGVWSRKSCETVLAPFEDTEVMIPRGYDQILSSIYGNYMQLPPEEERIGHHFYSIIKR